MRNNKEDFRPIYHFTPEVGWLNDPNGLIYFKGKYHFFYQSNPYDTVWGRIHWGHAVSDDMKSFTYLPIALTPGEWYDDDVEGGCYSGSALITDEELILAYTGAAKVEGKKRQMQCIARSRDGIHFEKYAGNPVIEAPPDGYLPSDFRDPKIWKHEGRFYMLCGATKDECGALLLYRSDNMKDFTFFSVLTGSEVLGEMPECPDFFMLLDKYVLIFSPITKGDRRCVYQIGDMDYQTGHFTCESRGILDYGSDFYAPQTFLDEEGRRILVGWAYNWENAARWKQYIERTGVDWCGAFTVPREVNLATEGGLCFQPIKGVTDQDDRILKRRYDISDGKGLEKSLWGNVFDLEISADLDKQKLEDFHVQIRAEGGYTPLALRLDLKRCMLIIESLGEEESQHKRTEYSFPKSVADEKKLVIRILSDRSSVEIFAFDGRFVYSENVFTGSDSITTLVIR